MIKGKYRREMIRFKEEIFNEIAMIEDNSGISIILKSRERAQELVLYTELTIQKALEKYALIAELIEQDKIIEVH